MCMGMVTHKKVSHTSTTRSTPGCRLLRSTICSSSGVKGCFGAASPAAGSLGDGRASFCWNRRCRPACRAGMLAAERLLGWALRLLLSLAVCAGGGDGGESPAASLSSSSAITSLADRCTGSKLRLILARLAGGSHGSAGLSRLLCNFGGESLRVCPELGGVAPGRGLKKLDILRWPTPEFEGCDLGGIGTTGYAGRIVQT